ncbi:MAG: dUTP diphosphatase [Acidimicrobiales bacterium]|nr:dUTP diphosphatase [Acidimicrobiales bacterium]
MRVDVPFRSVRPDAPEVPRPIRAGDAAADLRAAESFTLEPGERALVPTGWSVAVPHGMAGLVMARSGLAIKHGIALVNSPGLVDSGYRGELRVILINHGQERFAAAAGERIAQFMVISLPTVAFTVVEELPEAIDLRGTAGFGSSGRA